MTVPKTEVISIKILTAVYARVVNVSDHLWIDLFVRIKQIENTYIPLPDSSLPHVTSFRGCLRMYKIDCFSVE